MASTIKVDNVQNQPGTNIINKCGTTITLGASSDTIALAAGASQTGFGRTGTVDWVTTPKVTGDSPVTAATGSGYFLNTTAGTITINLPAGAAGSIVSMADYAGTWQTYNVTVNANGTEKIGGVASTPVTLNTEGQSVTLVYVDSTQGWVNTMDSTSNVRGNAFILATGGCITTCGNFKIHTFLGPATFTVTNGGSPVGSTKVDYLVTAGGGGGSNQHSGGGGAGGYRTSFPSPGCNAGTVTVSSSPGAYPITVGGGGAGIGPAAGGACVTATPGVASVFDSYTSAGGGGGGAYPGTVGASGGSGGGGGTNSAAGGAGNTPAIPVPEGVQGYAGGTASAHCVGGGGGGGGAAAVGGNALPNAGVGGAGAQNNIDGNNYYWAGGGGGGAHTLSKSGGAGGIGGGGGGGSGNNPTAGTGGGSAINDGTAGTAGPPEPGSVGGAGGINSGGGGGSSGANGASGGSGGSGIVIIRYKYQ